jgi:Mn2+/Fe2+ NRAMP family transporter
MAARSAGTVPLVKAYIRLSGPGWLQSAITLGGGSLSGALFLGVLGGYTLLWLQGVAVVLGVIMLSAISYVTLSTKEKPFAAINKHVNPVLGWGWAIGSLLASMVWCLPQFSLSTAVVQQNLLPEVFGSSGLFGETGGKVAVCALLLGLAFAIVFAYDRKGRGVKVFERTMKSLVGLIVLAFFGVVLKLSFTGEGLPWGQIFAGFIPNFSTWSNPSPDLVAAISQVGPAFQGFWTDHVLSMQRDVMIAAASAAVGINMTFLMPYSMLARGWDKEFRGLAVFDLSTGMVIPFIAVTGCVVIAATSQFHAKPETGLLEGHSAPAGLVRQYEGLLDSRLVAEQGAAYTALEPAAKSEVRAALPEADRRMAAMLVKRDAFNLSSALAPLTGNTVANWVFGLGVLGMGLSTIVMLMLISGFVICEMFGLPQGGKGQRIGAALAAVGALGPFVWSGKTAFWLAVPTSIVGMVLLPIAYFTFMLMMNNRSLMGDSLAKGSSRIIWNVLMGIASVGAAVAAVWSIWAKAGKVGMGAAGAFIALVIVVGLARRKPQSA